MIFTTYLDKSDTHGTSPDMIMAGFLGHRYQWRRFQKKLAKIQLTYQFRIFHATDFISKTGEFKGWSDEKCMALVHELTNLVQFNLTEGFTIDLSPEEYAQFCSTGLPPGMRVDSQYGSCFRGCIAHLIHVLQSTGPSTRLNIVLEVGHKNAGDCERIFVEIKKVFGEFGDTLLGDFSKASKQDAMPLMVADFLAFTYSKMRGSGDVPNDWRENGMESWRKPAGRAGLTHLRLHAEGLQQLKDNFQRLREARQANWRVKRDARRAAQR